MRQGAGRSSGDSAWRQARYFARLKGRLVRNGLRKSAAQKVGLIIGSVYAVPLAVAGFVGLATTRFADDAAVPLITGAFVVLFLGWLVGPLLGFGTDETLDPARLATLPLPPRRQASGLLAASCVGVAPLATALVLAGAVVGLAPPGPGAVVVVAAAVVELGLCLVGSRALTTALSRILRSRKGRDLAILAGSLLGLSLAGAGPVVRRVAQLDDSDLDAWAGVLAWTPPGMTARAALEARSGDLGTAVLALGGSAAVVALLAWCWVSGLERLLTTTTRHPAGGAGRARSGLFRRGWAWLPRDRRGAVAAKELLYYTREPRQRTGTVTWVVLAVGLAVVVAAGGREDPAVLAATALAGLGSLTALNQFGIDGRAYWFQIVAAGEPRADLVGKNLALGLFILVAVGLEAAVLSALTGGWVYLPVALGLSGAVAGVGLAVGNVVSVRLPVPMPETTNPFASNPGQGCSTMLLQSLSLAVQAVLLVPVLVLVVVAFAWQRQFLAVVALAAPLYGLVVWRVGLRLSSRHLADHQPEFLGAFERG